MNVGPRYRLQPGREAPVRNQRQKLPLGTISGIKPMLSGRVSAENCQRKLLRTNCAADYAAIAPARIGWKPRLAYLLGRDTSAEQESADRCCHLLAECVREDAHINPASQSALRRVVVHEELSAFVDRSAAAVYLRMVAGVTGIPSLFCGWRGCF